jgi:hypothetical protein
MKLLLEKTRKHLDSQNETYFEHMWAAWKIVYLLKTLEVKCLVHSLFPFLYIDAVSTKIECLQKMTKRNKDETIT